VFYSHNEILAGLDIGSVSARLVVLLSSDTELLFTQNRKMNSFFTSISDSGSYRLFTSKRVQVLGDPFQAARMLLGTLLQIIPEHTEIKLQATGSQAKLISQLLEIPHVNEFKAISRGVVELVPDANTVFEIGGNGSRYIRVTFDSANDELSILDYQRNGECAAGTGSFIDQQAARLRYDIEEIGPLVLQAKEGANIAGRCSVFAKSDMVHAQQRGYSPAAIFKGLCEAVVRNYKGTVLRGKELVPKVVFVGGVAANLGVVAAVRDIFGLQDEELVVPQLHAYVGALGCALQKEAPHFQRHLFDRLSSYTQEAVKGSSARLQISRVRFPDEAVFESMFKEYDGAIDVYLGIDIGSVSTNFVLLDTSGRVLDEIYTRTDGRPIEVVQREFDGWQKKWGDKLHILGVGTTGSGRELIGELVGADAIHDEITAHKTGAGYIAKTLHNEKVDTIFEIGGQDSKFISIEDDVVVDFAMNEACAAGTGSFLEEQAAKLGISIKEDFARLALSTETPVQMGERCTVFMEKDVTAYMQQGVAKEDITAGLALAVVQNYLNRVVRGRRIGDVIYFQGGTAYNKSVAAAFATVLHKKIIVPPHNGVMGAIGAALLAKDKVENLAITTRFRGFDLSAVNFKVRHFTCKACSNLCDMQQVTVEGEKTYWGDKCSERYRKKRKVQRKPIIPDLVETYLNLLQERTPGPDGLGLRIGIPRSLYFYDRYPFWATYFGELGAEVVLSDLTHKKIVAEGKELTLSEPCFPIVASHGHFKDVFDKNVDYVFIPNVINSETDDPERESWFCPWGQTLPLVLKNTLAGTGMDEIILSPNIRFRNGEDSVKKALEPLARQLGVSKKKSNAAVALAFQIQASFRTRIKDIGLQVLKTLEENNESGIVIIGRPYNIYDAGLNLRVPGKLRDDYGINVIPMDFLPFENTSIRDIHDNMFWNYGRRILQAARYVGEHSNLHVVYFTNFKCGPDSYIKHFVRDTLGSPYLTLQFDDHSNDAGIMTRCEAYLESKDLLRVVSGTKEEKRLNRNVVIAESEQMKNEK